MWEGGYRTNIGNTCRYIFNKATEIALIQLPKFTLFLSGLLFYISKFLGNCSPELWPTLEFFPSPTQACWQIEDCQSYYWFAAI